MTPHRIAVLLVGLAASVGAQQPVPIAPTGAEPRLGLIRPPTFQVVPDSLRSLPLAVRMATDRAQNFARDAAKRSWVATSLTRCVPVPLKDTTGWTLRSTKDYPLLGPSDPTLPTSFAADTGFQGAHGGLRWKSSTEAFTLEFGHWGEGIDETNGRTTSCLITTRSGTYAVSERVERDGYSFSAVPINRPGPTMRVVGHARTEDDLRIPWTALILLYLPW